MSERIKRSVYLQKLKGLYDYRAFDAYSGQVVPIADITIDETTMIKTDSGEHCRVIAWDERAQKHADRFKAFCSYPAITEEAIAQNSALDPMRIAEIYRVMSDMKNRAW